MALSDALTSLDQVFATRVIPVIALADVQHAAPLAQALVEGELPVAEVTFRTPAAAESIKIMSEDPRLLVGAGTVINADQVDAAVANGAKFVVSPGFSASVANRCGELGVSLLPGAATATEIMMALDAGLEVCKFFPAGTSGGPAAIKALAAPFPQVRFIPTGGVTLDNLADYFALDSVVACGGSWMVPSAAVAAGDMATIAGLARAAVGRAKELRR